MPFLVRIKLLAVDLTISFFNVALNLFKKILFKDIFSDPLKILIYKVGNIGDIVCAVPAIIAIRKAYPRAEITLLTSPGAVGGLGARELLDGAWYIDRLKVYYSEDVASFGQKSELVRQLKGLGCDLFIQLPDDIANFRTLLRNMVFAKIIGAKSAFGFKIRTIQLFKKSQIDYTFQKTEPESLMDLLRENGIKDGGIEYDFNVSDEERENVGKIISGKWPDYEDRLIIAMSPGGKREGNQWPIDKFADLAARLADKYKAGIVVLGGKGDVGKANSLKSRIKSENILIAAGKLNLLETYEFLKHCSFLVSNSTGTIHLAAAAGTPAVGIYSIRDVFGRWFPYGRKNQVVHQSFLGCDYKDEDCIRESIANISVNDVSNACDLLLKQIT